MKKIGIVIDNYKLEKFRQGLKDIDVFINKETPFIQHTTILSMICSEHKIDDIAKMCKKLEIDFKASN